MKKILKNRIVQITFAALVIGLLIVLCVFNRVDENIVTRVSKILGPKYYKIECVTEKCEYVAAYSGKEDGKTDVKIINSKGKTIIKYTVDNSEKPKKVLIANTDKYAILALRNEENYTQGYSVINTKGKEILQETNADLYVLTSKLFYGIKDNLYTIYDAEGNIVYKDVKQLNTYNSNKIITFVNNELNIIDEKSERILDDYEIVEEVKEEKTLYLILKDKDNVYYYFDVKTNTIVGDSFSSYVVMSDNKLLVTRKNNNKIEKYLLNKKGEVEQEISSKSEIVKKVKEGFEVDENSVLSVDQKGVLVRKTDENSYGTYDLKTGDYTKLFDFNDNEDKVVNIYNLYEDLTTARLEIGCSKTYCNEEVIAVYNPFENAVTFKVVNSEKQIKNYREYENGYKVITYRDKTYSLINRDSEEVINSKNNIIVLGEKRIVDDNASDSNVIIFLSKENKVINDENSLAYLTKTSEHKIYRFYDEEKTYIYNEDGKLLKEIPISESSITAGDKYISYYTQNKINVYSLIDNTEISLDITKDQSYEDENGAVIAPNKGMIVITDKNNIKVLNFNKKTIKTIKNSTVKSVNFNEKSNTAFMIIKQDENYGLYIIK